MLRCSMKRLSYVSFGLVAVVAMLGLVGCESSRLKAAVKGLRADLVNLSIAADGSAKATLRYVNPNVIVYNVASAKHRIYINGRFLANAEAKKPAGVPPTSELVEQDVTFKVPPSGWPVAGAANYRVESTINLLVYDDNEETHRLESAGQVVVQRQ